MESIDTDPLKAALAQARVEISKVIIGQQQVIDYCLVVILSGCHALIEGVPGIGKTLLVKTLGHVLGCEHGRIQFTPDLMPSDITGTNIFNLQKNEFNLAPGPIFTSFLLADEINRAPAKTQSALLQGMQERVVSIDRDTYQLPRNFTVFATQNPIESEGTYPLPEAQKDRFMLKISMNFPDRAEELHLASSMLSKHSPESILQSGHVHSVLNPDSLAHLRESLNHIVVREELVGYLVDLVRNTREHPSILVGAGPRATQSLLLASRSLAAIRERDFVTPDDIKEMALPTLGHRLILRPEFEMEGVSISEVIQQILQSVEVPR
jgi:MoxR-like ATPase